MDSRPWGHSSCAEGHRLREEDRKEEQSLTTSRNRTQHHVCETRYLASNDYANSNEEAADRRREEMQGWMQDWQIAGQWLLTQGTQTLAWTPQGDSDFESPTGDHTDRPRTAEEYAEESRASSLYVEPRRCEERLEKRRSIRIRMQRGVSDGYVLALKTVAAVRRAASTR